MISFREYLGEHLVEAFGDSAKYYKAIQTVEAALDQATRPYERMHEAKWVRYMGPNFRGRAGHTTRPELQFLKKAKELWLKGDLATHAVIWLLDFDQSTRPTMGPLGTNKLKMDTAVIAEPVNGELIVVMSMRTPHPAFRYKKIGNAIGFGDIRTAVNQAIGPLKFFADNHHKAHYYEQYLGEDAGDRAAQIDREWLAKQIDLIDLVKKQLNDSVRVAHNLNYITSAKWRLWRGQAGGWSSSNIRKVISTLKPNLQKTAVVFALEVKDTRPKHLDDGPLGARQLPFGAVVVVDPVEGNMIAVPDIRQPHKSTFSKGYGAAWTVLPPHHGVSRSYSSRKVGNNEFRLANMFRIDKVIKVATQNIVFYARNHHKARRG